MRSRSGWYPPSWAPRRSVSAVTGLLLAGAALAFVGALALAARNPSLGAVDARQYDPLPEPILCYGNLTGDRPGCAYVRPALTGLPVATPLPRDPGREAAAALSGGDAAVLRAAEHLVSTQEDGVWPYAGGSGVAGSDLPEAWVSASAQGLGISVLARAMR